MDDPKGTGFRAEVKTVVGDIVQTDDGVEKTHPGGLGGFYESFICGW